MAYKYWINPKQLPMTGYYYYFKSFKVYWAYRWFIAEQIDKRGVLDGTDNTCTKIIYTNYREQYDNIK